MLLQLATASLRAFRGALALHVPLYLSPLARSTERRRESDWHFGRFRHSHRAACGKFCNDGIDFAAAAQNGSGNVRQNLFVISPPPGRTRHPRKPGCDATTTQPDLRPCFRPGRAVSRGFPPESAGRCGAGASAAAQRRAHPAPRPTPRRQAPPDLAHRPADAGTPRRDAPASKPAPCPCAALRHGARADPAMPPAPDLRRSVAGRRTGGGGNIGSLREVRPRCAGRCRRQASSRRAIPPADRRPVPSAHPPLRAACSFRHAWPEDRWPGTCRRPSARWRWCRSPR